MITRDQLYDLVVAYNEGGGDPRVKIEQEGVSLDAVAYWQEETFNSFEFMTQTLGLPIDGSIHAIAFASFRLGMTVERELRNNQVEETV